MTPTAALAATTRGIQAVVNDTNALYVEDATPAAEARYRARFYFDPNDFDPGVLRRQSGAYSLEGRVRRNGDPCRHGIHRDRRRSHAIEINWVRASAPAAADGTFELFVDNQPVSFLTGIDDDASNIDSVRLGALAVKVGAGGTLYFDELVSRRQSYTGP